MIPWRNSSGNVASEASSRPSARSPRQVNAREDQLFRAPSDRTAASADSAQGAIRASQARPAADVWKDKNSYCPLSAGTRSKMICWMSSNSSTADLQALVAAGREVSGIVGRPRRPVGATRRDALQQSGGVRYCACSNKANKALLSLSAFL